MFRLSIEILSRNEAQSDPLIDGELLNSINMLPRDKKAIASNICIKSMRIRFQRKYALDVSTKLNKKTLRKFKSLMQY